MTWIARPPESALHRTLSDFGLEIKKYPMWALLFGYGKGGLIGLVTDAGSIGIFIYNVKIARMYGTPVYVWKNGKIVAEKP
jgi:hypothetical protein